MELQHTNHTTYAERHRDLARTHPVRLLDRQFPENLLFGQAKFLQRIFSFDLWEVNIFLPNRFLGQG